MEKVRILIAVPSKNRVKSFKMKTYDWLKHTQYDFKIFVEPQDLQQYKDAEFENLVCLDANDQGTKYAKIKIRDYAKENGYTHIFKCDDDVTSWRNPLTRGLGHSAPKYEKKWKTENIFDPIITNSIQMFEQFGDEIKGVSLMYGWDMREFENKTWIFLNKRLQSNYIVDIEHFVSNEHNLLFGFEDFETFFEIIKKGFKTIQYGLTGMDCDVKVLQGGHQSKCFNRNEMELQHAELLKEWYPFVPWKKTNEKFEIQPDLRSSTIKPIKL